MPGAVQSRAMPSPAGKPFARGRRNLRLNATLLCIVAAFLPESQSYAQTPPVGQGVPQPGLRSYDIEAGPLAQVLNRFAQEAGVLLSFDAAALQGRHSGGVHGRLPVGEGFRQLLAGSGLEAVATGADRYVLRPVLPELSGEDRASKNATELEGVLVTAERTRDEVGHDNVYEKDISNLYVDRKYMERYRGVSTGDVFAGMNGVYNTDNRNGSALSPNLRGLSGNGRIPVTIDGTVQSIDVFMARQGVNNRSYVDPNMFSSIHVEKGPSMTRGLKSGIGGSVEIRTIEADDIIKDDRNWGVQVKGGTASNSIEPSFDAKSIAGRDYRDIPGVLTSGPWATPGLTFNDPLTERRSTSDTDLLNLDDRKFFIAGAWRNEQLDLLAAYSDARRGNYFAGKNGVGDYRDNVREQGSISTIQSIKNLYPNIGKIYAGGWEVPYTSTHTESLLLKGNLKLSDNQKLSLSYSSNKIEFGELPALLSDQYIYDAETQPDYDTARTTIEYPFPLTNVDQKIYRLGYEWKPAGSSWVDLEASVWRSVSDNTRYQNGDFTYQVSERDVAWDDWTRCRYMPAFCSGPAGDPPPKEANTDGKYDIFIGNRQDSRSTRTGMDISNAFRLSDSLKLTAAADWQYEERKDTIPVESSVLGVGPATVKFGPASGRRQEYGASMNLDWQATSRFNLSAGVRYGSFWSYDDETAKRHAAQDPNWNYFGINTHQQIKYQRIATDDEIALFRRQSDFSLTSAERRAAREELNTLKAANNITNSGGPRADRSTGILWWDAYAAVPLNGAVADSAQNPFYNGSIDVNEVVVNPQGISGEYNKYQYVAVPDGGAYIIDSVQDPYARRPETQREHAWSGQFVASYLLTDRSKAYLRYGSMARFPSILESAGFKARNGGVYEYALKPERNDAWEIGYTYNLAGLLSGLQVADVKVSYYHNTIHDFYDRATNLAILQFDRKVMSGYELQGRADTGRYFASLGISYRDKQEVCDKDFAVSIDPYYNRLPECMPGGMPNSLSFISMQPKYSINLDLGTRLFNSRLELGARLRYHSSVENTKLEKILAGGYRAFTATTRPYYWSAVKLVDLYAEYRPTRDALLRLSVDNLTNRYYLDPLSKVASPGPGRTIMLDVEYNF